MLAEVTHETRRPLGLARGYVSILLEEQPGPLTAAQRNRLIQVDEKLAEAQAQLDNRLVLLSKLELNEGRAASSLQGVDLLADVERAIERARVRADQASGQLELRHPEPPIRARADSMLLSRVLDNLLENALLYSDGPPQVSVEVGSGNGDRPFVRVVDQGAGMSPSIAEEVFAKGFRGDPSGPRPGTGLGLWLSRRAAEQMHARLELESTQEGGGSAFRLELQPDRPNHGGAADQDASGEEVVRPGEG